jgi:hypothetical protein
MMAVIPSAATPARSAAPASGGTYGTGLPVSPGADHDQGDSGDHDADERRRDHDHRALPAHHAEHLPSRGSDQPQQRKLSGACVPMTRLLVTEIAT